MKIIGVVYNYRSSDEFDVLNINQPSVKNMKLLEDGKVDVEFLNGDITRIYNPNEVQFSSDTLLEIVEKEAPKTSVNNNESSCKRCGNPYKLGFNPHYKDSDKFDYCAEYCYDQESGKL